jgi:hypothetical protein
VPVLTDDGQVKRWAALDNLSLIIVLFLLVSAVAWNRSRPQKGRTRKRR